MALPGTADAASKTGRTVIRLLVSNAIITGAKLSKAQASYSGGKYATGF